jgi:AcrR family transcriptional regulator
MKRTDPRVVRTRQMLRDALIATILEKGYDATNIQEITERAGLRRATFYLHYRDKEELLLTMLHETLEELIQQMNPQHGATLSEESERAEEVITFTFIQKHADLYRAILRGQGASEITRSIRDYLAVRIAEMCTDIQRDNLPIPIEVLANYLAAVKLNMVIWWLDKGMPYTPQQMADMVTRLVLNGTEGIFSEAATAESR